MNKVVAITTILLMLAGCGDSDSVIATPPAENEDIVVGAVLPLSGPIAGLGMSMLNSAELAQAEINAARPDEPQLQLVVEDSEGEAGPAVAAYQQFIEDDQVVAILGPVTSSATAEAFPIAQANRIVALSPTAAAAGLSELGDFVFLANLTVDTVVPGGVALTQERLGYEQVAIITDEDDLFSQSGLEILQDTFVERGVEVVTTESFADGETDFTSQLDAIKESDPDALFISTLPGEAAEILIQAQQVELPSDISIIIPLAFSSEEVVIAGDAAEGVITFSTWDSAADAPGNQAFVQTYTETFGSEPNRFAAQWYAAVNLLALAIQEADSLEPDDLRDALAGLQEVETVLGEFSFDADGGAIFDPIILVVRDGTLEPF